MRFEDQAQTGIGRVRIQQGFPADQRRIAAEIYWTAFGDKLGRVLGPKARAVDFLQQGLSGEFCFAALDEAGRLLGIAGFKTPQGSFSAGSEPAMRRVYGMFGAMWRIGLLRLLADDIDNQRFLIDGIAVAPEARNRGIGTALLQALYREAAARGYDVLRLEVVDSNLRAMALYEREGFVAARTERMGWLRYIFGFRAAITMLRMVR